MSFVKFNNRMNRMSLENNRANNRNIIFTESFTDAIGAGPIRLDYFAY